ncbi:hypothetical protein NDU88_000311 [Pleurodeles waltl]|uniref:Uncharacterized protein n=1 Tax=Pleurodeles waltl TaxID=8319 RepID=A0AAV7MGJ1_PLEWA|nr:hypothetical protein NDU88_000311 [Pleurodeles waltl]
MKLITSQVKKHLDDNYIIIDLYDEEDEETRGTSKELYPTLQEEIWQLHLELSWISDIRPPKEEGTKWTEALEEATEVLIETLEEDNKGHTTC